MLCSIIILNWNRPEDTIRAVESVLIQDAIEFEVIVWDNASTDNSAALLSEAFKNESHVRLIWSEKNYGVAGGRNQAVLQSNGAIIVFLDNDAVFTSRKALYFIEEFLTDASKTAAVSFEVIRPDQHLMWPFVRSSSIWRDKNFEIHRLDGCGFAIQRPVFVEVGMFAEHFSPYGAEDAYLAFNLLKKNFRIMYLPSVQIVHHFNSEGRHGNQSAMHVRNMIWIRMEIFPFPFNILFSISMMARLFFESISQQETAFFFKGAWSSLTGFKRSRRAPMSYRSWKRLRRWVRQDKKLRNAERL